MLNMQNQGLIAWRNLLGNNKLLYNVGKDLHYNVIEVDNRGEGYK